MEFTGRIYAGFARSGQAVAWQQLARTRASEQVGTRFTGSPENGRRRAASRYSAPQTSAGDWRPVPSGMESLPSMLPPRSIRQASRDCAADIKRLKTQRCA